MTERLFVGIDLDDDVRHGLAAFLTAELGGRPLPGKPVAAESWHLTLRFLGATTAAQRDRVVSALDVVDVSRFTMSFGGLGAFPRPARAAVIWLGVAGDTAPLERLAEACEAAARGGGLDAEERPFHPHLTLARVRPPEDVRTLVESVARFPLRQPVSSIALFRSTLGPQGARYEIVDRLELAS